MVHNMVLGLLSLECAPDTPWPLHLACKVACRPLLILHHYSLQLILVWVSVWRFIVYISYPDRRVRATCSVAHPLPPTVPWGFLGRGLLWQPVLLDCCGTICFSNVLAEYGNMLACAFVASNVLDVRQGTMILDVRMLVTYC